MRPHRSPGPLRTPSLVAAVCATGWLGLVMMSVRATAAQEPKPAAGTLPVFHVRDRVHLVIGPSSNSIVHVGDSETLVVDTQPEGQAAALLATIRSITTRPIRYIVNTHGHPANRGGNVAISRAGSTVGGNNATGIAGVSDATSRAAIIAHQNVLDRLSRAAGGESAPFDAWPTDSFVIPRDEVFNDEAVQLFHQPAAHTDGDIVVLFRRSDVVATGDLFSTHSYPIVDDAMGGTINGVVAALNNILDMTVPGPKQEGGTFVVPGRGRVADEADVVEYRDMVTIVRDRVRDMKARGMSLAQVQAVRPTIDYDPRYDVPDWPADKFVEAIFRTLPAAAPRGRR